MENDFLKKYIQEHKSAFEEQEPSTKIFEKVMQKLPTQRKIKTTNYQWLAIACTILLAFGLFLVFNRKNIKPTYSKVIKSTNNQISEEQTLSKHIAPQLEVSVQTKKIKIDKKRTYKERINSSELEIINQLKDTISTANRLNALINLNEQSTISKVLNLQVQHTFSYDENSTVRLAALELLSKKPEYNSKYLANELSKQQDPMIQMELIKMLKNTNLPNVDKGLASLAINPNNIEQVRSEAMFALAYNK